MESQDNLKSPQEVLNTMLANDAFSKWLGLHIDKVDVGYCKLHFSIKKEMLNGFSSVHGGVLFSAADSAFAFACNSHGVLSVALDVNISFTRPVKLGDIISIEANEIYLGKKTGIYDIKLFNEQNELVAFFKGTSYRTSRLV
ncbi:MAG: hydroxyphenylacetyl-CoA thioesterase PaaI [Bacteroidetes bacterium]|nr:hydroxyphenylacetyl-CoA thioesterase PaaI [Bacteroidota bacterium]